MVPADDAVLRFLWRVRDLRGNPAIQTPAVVAVNIGYSRKHVGRRMRTLSGHDLVERADVDDGGEGYYRLAPRGVRLLAGTIDPTDVA